jgi:soluble P-type ATPase
MKKMKSPEIIDVSVERLEELKSRITSSSPLLEEDKSVILAIVSAYVWIQAQLQSAKLTIHRLKKLFGFSTEKRRKISEKREKTDLVLDLNTLGALQSPEGSLNALQTISMDPPTKK